MGFYGTADLIGWCQERTWDYRLRLKGNLVVFDGTDKTTTGKCARDRVYYLENVELTGRRARTHIGIIQDPGHAEPWIIAMSEKPGYLRTLEYADRWGIEPMFADFKSRGFGIEDTQLRYPDRLDRLILVMALALYVAVSTGQWDAVHWPTPSEKKIPRTNRGRSPEAELRWTPLVRQSGWRVKRESRGIIAPCRCWASVSARAAGEPLSFQFPNPCCCCGGWSGGRR